MEKDKLESIAIYLEQKGLKEVRVSGLGKSKPLPIADKDGVEYQPDITARHFQSKYIYQIEPSDADDNSDRIAKWRFFSEYANRTGGRLVLIVRSESADQYQSILEEHEIESHFLKMKEM